MVEVTRITNATVVTGDELLENATITIVDGWIHSVNSSEDDTDRGEHVIEASGAYVIPGIIDTHNDSLETEINPRPSVALPPEFALANFERRAAASGVTTSFHAISFANIESKNRTIERSRASAQLAISAGATGLIEHQVLHRCDVWTPEGVEPIFESMKSCSVAAVSINDHMPGQGQFRDLEKFKEWVRSYQDDDSFDADAEIERRLDYLKRETDTVRRVHDEIAQRSADTETIIVSHDDDSPEKVDQMVRIGATVAEFPITLESAHRARDRGMWITVGAPNVVRGGSTSNNLSARELIVDGLADIICGDYHTPSLLLAAFLLAERKIVSLPQAVRMVTTNAADAFGLTDRGRITGGALANLAVVRSESGIPQVETTMRSGRAVFSTNRETRLRTTSSTDPDAVLPVQTRIR